MKSIIFHISFLFVAQLQAEETAFKYVKRVECNGGALQDSN
jgi:hypothetical protein